MVGEEAPSLKNIELIDLRKSPSLRRKILDSTTLHFAENPAPKGSFKKKYASKKQEQIDSYQQQSQSKMNEEIKEAAAV